jgi:hypothetical protein
VRSIKSGGAGSVKNRITQRLNEYLKLGKGRTWIEALDEDMSHCDKILFNFEEVFCPDGVCLVEFGWHEWRWAAYLLQQLLGAFSLDETSVNEASEVRMHVACAGFYWCIKDMISKRITSKSEFNDGYLRTACLHLPKIHGRSGLINRWGITTAACNNADTQREEAMFANKRLKIKIFTTRGGFKPRNHQDEHKDESIHRELCMRADCESIMNILYRTGADLSASGSHHGPVTKWYARDDCPLKFDIVIPTFMLEPGTAGAEYFSAFVADRGFAQGIHYRKQTQTGWVFHTVSPRGEVAGSATVRLGECALAPLARERVSSTAMAWQTTISVELLSKTVEDHAVEVTRQIEVVEGKPCTVQRTCKPTVTEWRKDQIRAACERVWELVGRPQRLPGKKAEWAGHLHSLVRQHRDAAGQIAGALPALKAVKGSHEGLRQEEPDWSETGPLSKLDWHTYGSTLKYSAQFGAETEEQDVEAEEVLERASQANRNQALPRLDL